jgi:hypothetical protein
MDCHLEGFQTLCCVKKSKLLLCNPISAHVELVVSYSSTYSICWKSLHSDKFSISSEKPFLSGT